MAKLARQPTRRGEKRCRTLSTSSISSVVCVISVVERPLTKDFWNFSPTREAWQTSASREKQVEIDIRQKYRTSCVPDSSLSFTRATRSKDKTRRSLNSATLLKVIRRFPKEFGRFMYANSFYLLSEIFVRKIGHSIGLNSVPEGYMQSFVEEFERFTCASPFYPFILTVIRKIKPFTS